MVMIDKVLSKNKAMELEIGLTQDSWHTFVFKIEHTKKGDHCGFAFEFFVYNLLLKKKFIMILFLK